MTPNPSVPPAIILVLLLSSIGHAQSAPPAQAPSPPVFRVQVWGFIAGDFTRLVSDYSDLRRDLEKGLLGPVVTNDVAAIRKAVHALGSSVRVARKGAKQGDIFTPAIALAFKRALVLEMTADTWSSIMDDNPGGFSHRINGRYPEKRTLSSAPPRILAALPVLPDGLEYRFLGRHLILLDTRAMVILDRIPQALQSSDSRGRHAARR